MSVEDEANAVGDYWDGHPAPTEEPVTPEAQAACYEQMSAWESSFGAGGKGNCRTAFLNLDLAAGERI